MRKWYDEFYGYRIDRAQALDFHKVGVYKHMHSLTLYSGFNSPADTIFERKYDSEILMEYAVSKNMVEVSESGKKYVKPMKSWDLDTIYEYIVFLIEKETKLEERNKLGVGRGEYLSHTDFYDFYSSIIGRYDWNFNKLRRGDDGFMVDITNKLKREFRYGRCILPVQSVQDAINDYESL